MLSKAKQSHNQFMLMKVYNTITVTIEYAYVIKEGRHAEGSVL